MLRRILLSALLALLALLALSPAGAESIAVNAGGAAALIGADGAEKVAPGTYELIFALDGGALWGAGGYVGDAFRYALLDGEGMALAAQRYDMLSYAEGAVLFSQDGLCGAMDAAGNALVEPLYTQLVPTGAGGFLALTTDPYDEEPDELYALDASGAATSTGARTLGVLSGFSEGLMPLFSAEDGLYGYVDAGGLWAIAPLFSHASAFGGGRALASLPSGFGLIDKAGAWLLPPDYAYLAREGDLALAAPDADTVVALDAFSGAELFRLEGEGFSASIVGDRIAVCDAASARLYRADGTLVHEASPLAAYMAGEGGQSIVVDGGWEDGSALLLDTDGGALAGPYRNIFALGGGLYGFSVSNASGAALYGVLDASGAEVLGARYEMLSALTPERLLVRLDGVDGVIDLAGTWLYRFPAAEEQESMEGTAAPSA